jgi:hypothetical protein
MRLITFFFHLGLEPHREEGCRSRPLYHSRLGDNPKTSNPFRPLLKDRPDPRGSLIKREVQTFAKVPEFTPLSRKKHKKLPDYFRPRALCLTSYGAVL